MKNTEHLINSNIGNRLRRKRIEFGLTQDNAAKSVGVTFQQVQKYENGANALSLLKIHQFAELYKVPISYFFDAFNYTTNTTSVDVKLKENHNENDKNTLPSDREIIELVKAFKKLENPQLRVRLADLVRGLAENQSD